MLLQVAKVRPNLRRRQPMQPSEVVAHPHEVIVQSRRAGHVHRHATAGIRTTVLHLQMADDVNDVLRALRERLWVENLLRDGIRGGCDNAPVADRPGNTTRTEASAER